MTDPAHPFSPQIVTVFGGSGFIGRYVVRALLAEGHRVRVLDSLIEQVHVGRGRPEELDPEVELVVGDVRDEAAEDGETEALADAGQASGIGLRLIQAGAEVPPDTEAIRGQGEEVPL